MSTGRFLPTPVEKMLKDLASQNFPFKWNISNDGFTVSLNMAWGVNDERRMNPRSRNIKSPSMLRRDRSRMADFLERKNEKNGKDSTAMQLSPCGGHAKGMFSCSLPNSNSENLNIQENLLMNSVQAQGINCVTMTTQTESTQKQETLTQTDHGIMCDAETQCASNTLSDKVTQTVQRDREHAAVQTVSPASPSGSRKNGYQNNNERADRNGRKNGRGGNRQPSTSHSTGYVAQYPSQKRDSLPTNESGGFLYNIGEYLMDIGDRKVQITGYLPIRHPSHERGYRVVYPFGGEDPSKTFTLPESMLSPCDDWNI